MTRTDWQDFEKLVAEIQRQLAPSAEVRHNEKVRGAAGRLRQLDVTIRQNVGLYPVLIVIECRKYRRPVDIEKVEAFAKKLEDLGSPQGVMISPSGFDAGARAIAKQNFIRLLTYREAEALDWQGLFSSGNWFKMILSRSERIIAKAILEDGVEVDLGGSEKFLDPDAVEVATVTAFLEDFQKSNEPDVRVGPFCWNVQFDPSLYIDLADGRKKILTLVISGVCRTFEYAINVGLAHGHVLDDVLQEKEVYKELVTDGFDWRKLLESQSGRELTAEDWEALAGDPRFKIFSLNLEKTKRYLRVVITKKVEPTANTPLHRTPNARSRARPR